MVGCRSRRSWTLGSIRRARSWEVSVARRPCPPRPDVRLSPRQLQYWRCYLNVQRRYLSPEVSVHFIFFRLSISGELRTIHHMPWIAHAPTTRSRRHFVGIAVLKRRPTVLWLHVLQGQTCLSLGLFPALCSNFCLENFFCVV